MKKEEGIWVSEGELGEERAREGKSKKKNGERGEKRAGRRKEGMGGGWSVETAEGESFVLEN